jgi:hypothetical protein
LTLSCLFAGASDGVGAAAAARDHEGLASTPLAGAQGWTHQERRLGRVPDQVGCQQLPLQRACGRMGGCYMQ